MLEPRPIHVLSEVVANQIAAGEVIERPASVVKELVENALDAGATRIEVSLEGGGSKCIQVLDNGCGMSPEDALTSLQRQATSKIAETQDIERIATFGFRGEAIPSIASVSRFTLTTRPAASAVATSLTVTGGILESTNQAGHPPGTTITVRDLFFNTPARRKFLRAPATELSRIRQSLTAIALAHPTVALRLQSEGRDLLRLPQEDTLQDRIRALLGEPTLEALLPIEYTQGDIHIHGYIARPDFIRGGTPEQYIFVNQRPATAPQIQYALREAWQNTQHRPLAILFIDLPPEEVDVNVHPAKREIRFRHGNHLINALIAAITQALKPQQAEEAPPAPLPTIKTAFVPPPPPAPVYTPSTVRPQPRQTQLPISVYPTPQPLPQALEPLKHPSPAVQPVPLPQEKSALPYGWLRVSDILDNRYWLVATDQGLLVVYAKAAIERILYERLAATSTEIVSQPLLIPETLQLPPVDAERVARFLPELEASGFGIGKLSSDTFILDALPVALSELPPKEILAEIAAELDQTGTPKNLNTWRREVVTRAAAKAAAQSYPIKDLATAQTLLEQLAHCSLPYTTPRGKPTMILTTYPELARRFQIN